MKSSARDDGFLQVTYWMTHQSYNQNLPGTFTGITSFNSSVLIIALLKFHTLDLQLLIPLFDFQAWENGCRQVTGRSLFFPSHIFGSRCDVEKFDRAPPKPARLLQITQIIGKKVKSVPTKQHGSDTGQHQAGGELHRDLATPRGQQEKKS